MQNMLSTKYKILSRFSIKSIAFYSGLDFRIRFYYIVAENLGFIKYKKIYIMKKLYLLTIVLLISVLLQGQAVLHYDFTNSLSDVNGNGPDLIVLGDEGTFIQDTLNEIGSVRKWAYRFDENSGLQMGNSTEFSLGESYTIEIYFVFDELNSWKRVVDWKNRKSDNGAYVYYGKLNFYPYITSGDAPVITGEYTYYVITRDAETKEVLIYTDAITQISMIDNQEDALIDGDNVLNFFHDDLIVPNEASSGAVAMIKIYDYLLDSSAIVINYENLSQNLFYIGEHTSQYTSMQIFPNPVSDRLNVDLSNFNNQKMVTLKLINSIGVTVFTKETNTINQQKIILNTSKIRNGIYLLTAESESRNAMGKVLIQH